ncbi:MAG: beta-glucosidase [Promethearchaeota archaeon]
MTLNLIMVSNSIYKGMNEKKIEEYVEKIIPQLTLREKVYLMSGHHFYKFLLKDRKIGARPYPGGGVKRLNIPPFMFTDGPRGVIIPGSTCFPVSMARAATWDINLEEKVGEAIGKEARARGANLFGGVCINLLRHPSWGRAQETYGEDTFLLGEMGSSLVRGVQKHNVMATIKHFAANSIEFSRFKVNVRMDERTLREVYLPHFKRCIDQGCATVMSAYNKLRGEYCGQNSYLLKTILKEEWNFKGFVHSDWMDGLYNTIKGIKGGLDVEMPRPKYYGHKLIKAVKKGLVSPELIDESAKRIILTVLKFVMREDPQKYDESLVGCEEHIQLAQKIAEKSMVLLKNEQDILPLQKEHLKKIAVIGRLAELKNTGDHGSSRVRQENVTTVLQGIKNFAGKDIDVVYQNGFNLKNALDVAQTTDAVILVVGYTYKDEGEYIKEYPRKVGDRLDLRLKSREVKLINAISKVNPNCVVILVGGSAIIVEEWKHNVPAIIMSWYSGMEGGTALANVIFGKINPSGKLPFTIPKNTSELPYFNAFVAEIEYKYYHGYTKFEKESIEPAFAFGFGLSYTKYKYDNLHLEATDDKVIVKVDVTNIGKCDGEEIVQVYVGFENSRIERPIKLLKGFKRINLKSNETKRVHIEFLKRDLAWYNPESKSWEIEAIVYSIYVGSSSKLEDLLKLEITIN